MSYIYDLLLILLSYPLSAQPNQPSLKKLLGVMQSLRTAEKKHLNLKYS